MFRAAAMSLPFWDIEDDVQRKFLTTLSNNSLPQMPAVSTADLAMGMGNSTGYHF